MQIASVLLSWLAFIIIAIMCVLLIYSIQKSKDRKKNKVLLIKTYFYIKVAIVSSCLLFYFSGVLGEYENYMNKGITNIATILYSVFFRNFVSVFLPCIAIFCVIQYLNRITQNIEA